jgi:hypothetical protein
VQSAANLVFFCFHFLKKKIVFLRCSAMPVTALKWAFD